MPIDKDYFKNRHAEETKKGTDYLSKRDRHIASSPSVIKMKKDKLARAGKGWLSDTKGVSLLQKALNKSKNK